MADDKLVVAGASSSSLQKRSDNDQLRVQDKQHYIDLPQVDSRHKPTVSCVATSNTRPKGIESLPPLPNVSATGKTDLPLVESVPKGANDRGTNHFLPHKNTEIRRLLAIHKQAQLEFGPSKIPSKAQNNTHFFSDKTSNFADVKLPNVVFKGDIANQKIRKKPGEASLPPLLQPSVAKRNSRLSEARRRHASRAMSIDEENDMWSMIAIVENKIDQMEEGKRAQYRTKNSHRYHLPVISVTDDLAKVPKPWPINLIVVHTNKDMQAPPAYNDPTTVTMPPEEHIKFGWKIRNISRRFEEAELSKAPFYSTTFTTGHNGYIMCLEAHLSGDGQDTHVSLYLVMLEPDHDHPLAWPFIKPVTFQLINQVDRTKSISMSFVSHFSDPSLKNPRWRDGLPRFFRRHLLLGYNNFNKDDQIIIKCKIYLNYNGTNHLQF